MGALEPALLLLRELARAREVDVAHARAARRSGAAGSSPGRCPRGRPRRAPRSGRSERTVAHAAAFRSSRRGWRSSARRRRPRLQVTIPLLDVDADRAARSARGHGGARSGSRRRRAPRARPARCGAPMSSEVLAPNANIWAPPTSTASRRGRRAPSATTRSSSPGTARVGELAGPGRAAFARLGQHHVREPGDARARGRAARGRCTSRARSRPARRPRARRHGELAHPDHRLGHRATHPPTAEAGRAARSTPSALGTSMKGRSTPRPRPAARSRAGARGRSPRRGRREHGRDDRAEHVGDAPPAARGSSSRPVIEPSAPT